MIFCRLHLRELCYNRHPERLNLGEPQPNINMGVLTRLNKGAFDGCSLYTMIYCEASSQPSGWSDRWCLSYTESNLVVWDCKNNDIASDGNIYCFDDNWIRYKLGDGIATVTRQTKALSGDIIIQNNVIYKDATYDITSIDYRAFAENPDITNVTIPSSVTSIGDSAFYRCSSLTNVTIGGNSQLTSIESQAFRYCSSLTKVATIPSSVTSIGYIAFPELVTYTIYCEAENEPSEWNYAWGAYATVIWGYKGN